MTLVVSDNSPLDTLVRLGHAGLLPRLFGEVVMPTQVRDELLAPDTPQETRSFIEIPPAWLTVREPKTVPEIPKLHLGERAAIALAVELRADLLLIDERPGRDEAKRRNLSVTGTVGILERAADNGWISLEETFEKLKKTDFYIRPGFLEERLESHRQRMQQKQDPRPK